MLTDEHLASANALFMTIDQGLRIITPLAGAGLYTAFGGPALAVGTAALLVLTAAGLLAVRIHEPRPERVADDQGRADAGWHALAAGFRHLRRTPVLLQMVIGLAVALGVIGIFDSVLFAAASPSRGRSWPWRPPGSDSPLHTCRAGSRPPPGCRCRSRS